MKFIQGILPLVFLLLSSAVFAQNDEKYIIHIKKTKELIKLDGLLDEAVWQQSDVAKDFFLTQPYDTAFAGLQTEVRILFDDNFIYVAARMTEPRENYIVSSLKRDFLGGTSDVFVVNIDPFKDKLNGFQFAVSPLNVQREGLISSGENTDNSWDNKWYSQVKNYDDHWVVEMAIPFKTIRYKSSEGANTWRINFNRNSMKTNEISNWTPVPRNFASSNLAFAGLMVWDDAPPKPGVNISVIPYLSGGLSKDFPRHAEDLSPQNIVKDKTGGIGLDAKIAVTPALNLDVTINPDFSQVEVDKQQTNLSRFELFFPERRQFFIENADLFGTFGFPDTRPFFSRRIGITRDPATGNSRQVPILGGVRLSGKINDAWRIGVMNMQTKKVKFSNGSYNPASNYTVLTAQRKVFDRSSIGGILVNKENFLSDIPGTDRGNFNRYNRVAGLEFNYYSPDNRIEAETYYHHSIQPNQPSDAGSFAHYMGYHHPNVDINLGMTRIGENYRAETGFVPRRGLYNLFRPVSLILNPKKESVSKHINSYGIGTEGSDNFDLKGKRLDSETNFFGFIKLPSQTEFYGGYYMNFVHLFEEFDPSNASDNPDPDFSRDVVPLPVGDYRSRGYFVGVETGSRGNFQVNSNLSWGGYFNGKGIELESSLAYRIQPYGFVTVDVNYNKIDLPKPYKSVSYWLVGPKAEMAFSRFVFFSAFFQYNTQTNNTNINSRLQWRFKPVSDFFLVYTDNYFSQDIPQYRINSWTPKNRALILKITYWLNV